MTDATIHRPLQFTPTEDRIALAKELHIDEINKTRLTFRNRRSGKEVEIDIEIPEGADKSAYIHKAKMSVWRELWRD